MNWLTSTKPAKGKVGEGDKAREVGVTYPYPKFENLGEAISDAGTEGKLLEFINSKRQGLSKSAATNAINSADAATADSEIEANAIKAARNATIADWTRRGTGANAKAALVDTLIEKRKRGEKLSDEELDAMLAQFNG
jgi:hypothetical protein